MDKKIVERHVHGCETDYIFWAGPGGRRVTKRVGGLRRHVILLYTVIGVMAASNSVLLIAYISKLTK